MCVFHCSPHEGKRRKLFFLQLCESLCSSTHGPNNQITDFWLGHSDKSPAACVYFYLLGLETGTQHMLQFEHELLHLLM